MPPRLLACHRGCQPGHHLADLASLLAAKASHKTSWTSDKPFALMGRVTKPRPLVQAKPYRPAAKPDVTLDEPFSWAGSDTEKDLQNLDEDIVPSPPAEVALAAQVDVLGTVVADTYVHSGEDQAMNTFEEPRSGRLADEAGGMPPLVLAWCADEVDP